jgi:hypothetical protein
MRKKVIQNLIDELETLVPAGEGFRYGVDHNTVYGGYRLVRIKTPGGAHYGCFGDNGCEPRLSYTNFVLKLRSLIEGAKAVKP